MGECSSAGNWSEENGRIAGHFKAEERQTPKVSPTDDGLVPNLKRTKPKIDEPTIWTLSIYIIWERQFVVVYSKKVGRFAQ